MREGDFELLMIVGFCVWVVVSVCWVYTPIV